MAGSPTDVFKLDDYIMHHITDAPKWEIPLVAKIPLPSFLSMHGLMLLIAAAILIMLFVVLYRRQDRVPRGLTNLLELFIIFVRDDIAIANLGKEDGLKLTPLFCTFFFFILCLNLMGLIPLFGTATGNINVTGALALITMSFMIFGSIYRNGLKGFLKVFMPSNVPWPILMIITPLEMVSVVIKTAALMIRLFANMLAGHMIILAMLGLVVLVGVYALPAILLAVMIKLLEVMVCFLQAYIFTLLSAVFISQTFHAEH